MFDIRYFSLQGKYRKENQDMLFIQNEIINQVENGKIKNRNIFNSVALADGMGGLKYGEIASRTCLEYLQNEKIIDEKSFYNFILGVSRRFKKINPNEKMGTTFAGMFFEDKKVNLYSIGDSRIFKFYKDDEGFHLELLTEDHSLAYESYIKNNFSLDFIRSHPQKNILTSCITSEATSISLINYKKIDYVKGDIFLICTDGVWENLSFLELKEILSFKKIGNSIRALKKRKYEMAQDNQTAILIKIE